jgi:hypothetical protein
MSPDGPASLAPLGTNLLRVWRFDTDATGSSRWSFYDPRPAFAEFNTLREMVDGGFYWIAVGDEQAARLGRSGSYALPAVDPHILETLMPEGNKSRVCGDGIGSKRPETNFPGISVDSNRVNRLVEKNGLGVEPRRLESPMK